MLRSPRLQAADGPFIAGLGLLVAFILALGVLATTADAQPGTPPGGGNPAGPKFAPPYRGHNGNRDSITIRCNENDPTGQTLIFRFQPWDDSDGWLEVTDVHGQYGVPARVWHSGDEVVLGNRQGQKVTYWSGPAQDWETETIAEHPGAREGAYTYNVVHGRCHEEPPPPPDTTTTTEPPPPDTTTTVPDDTTTTTQPPTTSTTEPPTTTTPEVTTTTQTFTTVPVTPSSAVPLEDVASVQGPTSDASRRVSRDGPSSMPLTGVSGLDMLFALSILCLCVGALLKIHSPERAR